eukprot:scaffold422_cov399-Prasinococcus_capsulatus_cf.AAC.7
MLKPSHPRDWPARRAGCACVVLRRRRPRSSPCRAMLRGLLPILVCPPRGAHTQVAVTRQRSHPRRSGLPDASPPQTPDVQGGTRERLLYPRAPSATCEVSRLLSGAPEEGARRADPPVQRRPVAERNDTRPYDSDGRMPGPLCICQLHPYIHYQPKPTIKPNP